jgi:hypothetical protein
MGGVDLPTNFLSDEEREAIKRPGWREEFLRALWEDHGCLPDHAEALADQTYFLAHQVGAILDENPDEMLHTARLRRLCLTRMQAEAISAWVFMSGLAERRDLDDIHLQQIMRYQAKGEGIA